MILYWLAVFCTVLAVVVVVVGVYVDRRNMKQLQGDKPQKGTP